MEMQKTLDMQLIKEEVHDILVMPVTFHDLLERLLYRVFSWNAPAVAVGRIPRLINWDRLPCVDLLIRGMLVVGHARNCWRSG